MSKKLCIGLIVFLFSLGLVATTAFAAKQGGPIPIDITTIYTVDSNLSTTQQSTFSWNEVPWLYFELPAGAGTNNIVTQSWWKDPSNVQQEYITQNEADNTIQVWQSLGSSRWDAIKTEGQWTILAQYDTTSKNTTGTGTTNFTVTAAPPPVVPEPVSSMLFLAGAATFGISRCWKKKRSA